MSALARVPVALGALLLAACASGPPAQLRMDLAPGAAAMFWPAAPEVPRFRYAGSLLGEGNYLRDGESRRSALGRAFDWIAGLDGSRVGPEELARPLAGAIASCGAVLVSDPGRQAVLAFAPQGELAIWEYASGIQRFASPAGIACGPGPVAWVADAQLGYVAELDLKGGSRRRIGQGVLGRPTGIAWDREARELYVADTKANDIAVFDPEGRLLRRLGGPGEAEGEFNAPTHLWFRDGELYVADTMNSRIQVFVRGATKPRLVVGSRGLFVGQLVRPKGVATDSAGNIYVIESYHDHLLVYDREGRFLLPIGGVGREPGQFYLPAGVWTDERDQVYVADMYNGRVVVLQFLGGEGHGAP